MSPDPEDLKAVATCIWKEARGENYQGMTAVGCVIKNRVESPRYPKTYLAVVMQPWAFSSMSAPHDPQLNTIPPEGDPQWNEAQDIAADIIQGNVADITGGATLYHDVSIGFPASWNRARCVLTVRLGRLIFYKEV